MGHKYIFVSIAESISYTAFDSFLQRNLQIMPQKALKFPQQNVGIRLLGNNPLNPGLLNHCVTAQSDIFSQLAGILSFGRQNLVNQLME